jgi:hypothetical protein
LQYEKSELFIWINHGMDIIADGGYPDEKAFCRLHELFRQRPIRPVLTQISPPPDLVEWAIASHGMYKSALVFI